MRPLPHILPAASIREMQPADVTDVAALAARIWHVHYVPHIVSAEQVEYMLERVCSPAAIVEQIKEKAQRFWLLHDENILIGYAAVEPRADGEWFIDKLYVDTTQQRRGLGKMLLAHIIGEHRPKALTLRVNRRNVPAINFYFRNGFVIEKLDIRDIGSGFVMDDFLMKRTLP